MEKAGKLIEKAMKTEQLDNLIEELQELNRAIALKLIQETDFEKLQLETLMDIQDAIESEVAKEVQNG